ncbi:MAG: hydroxymethylpyrimidine/phosphomethylpyrimidine kinase [Pseudomonadota bacterium]|nr:hydroxymethylpyrimidine/phosphomethylpyrimidine kinase [Pseudomonadota bacterium]MDP1904957.1 hydroxymethylpyrimidine/phosphomethylpyrimidine kinase [Pseudomonadota bacterium]MDP2354326.1 hydroxymethylpyrimidine/phosphomethylpyrimidine kinase [Pseudomonadota bacterium]
MSLSDSSSFSTPPPPIVLVFAGTDPTGGAGLQADILTLASLGCHPLSVVTAVTVQDTIGVDDYLPMDPEWIVDQARSVLEDMPVAAIKIGMIGSVEAVAAIAEVVSDYPDIPLVLDPVLSSGRGDPLANEELMAALIDLLLPQTTVLTPNSIEARRLAEEPEDDDEEDEGGEADARDTSDLAVCARHLIDMGCEFVLITGAHEQGAQVVNTLYNTRGVMDAQAWERLPGSYHGSGCTLASALAGFLALGQDVAEAAREAQAYTWQTLKHGYRPGMGQFIPDRMYWVHGDE